MSTMNDVSIAYDENNGSEPIKNEAEMPNGYDDAAGNGNENGAENGNGAGDGRQLSPSGDDQRSRSRSRSFEGRGGGNRRSGGGGGPGYRSRSRSPRRNNNPNKEKAFKRSEMGRGGRAGGGGGGGPQSQADRELGLKYRWEKTIYISNIPYEVRWTELKDLFRAKITDDIVYCEIFEKDGKSMGVGSMEFKNVRDAERAVEEMNQYEINGRKIAVRLDSEGFKTRQAKEIAGDYRNTGAKNQHHGGGGHHNNQNSGGGNYSNDQSNAFALASTLASLGGQSSTSTNLLNLLGLGGNNNGNSGSMGGGGGGGGGLNSVGALSGVYGGANPNATQMNLLNQLAAQLKVDGPVTNRIFVASLDYKVDEKKIREVYSLAGEVVGVSLFRDRDNRSRGMAVVEFETPLEALNAVSMFHNQTLLDRTMTVRFDTKPQKDDDGGGGKSKLPSGLKSIGSGIGSLLNQPSMPSHNSLNALSSMGSMSNMNNMNSMSSMQSPAPAPVPAAPDLTALASLVGLNTSNLTSILNTLGVNVNSGGSGGNQGGGGGQSNSGGHMNGSMDSYSTGASSIPSYRTAGSYNTVGNSNNSNNGAGANNNMNRMSGGMNHISKIFIKNIPFSWDDRKLKEKFRQAGNIEYAEVKMRDGKSKGCGLIRYSTPDQASKAVELFNGSRFEGRTLEVKIDQMP